MTKLFNVYRTKHLFPTILLTALMIACLASTNAIAQSSPTEVASQFYRAYLKLKIRGLPDDKQRKILDPLLSADMQRLLQAAKEKQESFIKEHPDEKPPWIEGDLFSSLFEGAHSFRLGPAAIQGDRAHIPVHLEYREAKNRTRWKDIIVLVRSDDGWRIWDILLKGDWQFKMGGSLRQILQAE